MLANNHASTIERAINSVLMQQTNIPFEVVAHDDTSADETAQSIRRYEERYPRIRGEIYQTENQTSKHDGTVFKTLHIVDVMASKMNKGDADKSQDYNS